MGKHANTKLQCTFLVHLLTLSCFVNALYTFFRKRHYRMFEQPVDLPPNTPSAHRVRVDSSPASSSPLRYMQNIISNAAAARAYPDAEREGECIALSLVLVASELRLGSDGLRGDMDLDLSLKSNMLIVLQYGRSASGIRNHSTSRSSRSSRPATSSSTTYCFRQQPWIRVHLSPS